MFTDKAQVIVDLAKDRAFSMSLEKLDVKSLLAAVGSDAEGSMRLAECLMKDDLESLRARCPDIDQPAPCPGQIDLEKPLMEIMVSAKQLASVEGIPDQTHPGLIDLRHLVCAIAMSTEVCALLGINAPLEKQEAIRVLIAWYENPELEGSMDELVEKLRGLRSELLAKIFGQDHAVHAFIEGLYNVEVTSAVDQERKKPAAVFAFAGPPGVGKTYLAELCASYLGRPFKHFDMTTYSDHQAHSDLVGFAKVYKGAQPGFLTGFVVKNPKAILLFDEIEKAHLNTMQIFYQILDAGRLEDKFLEIEVSFRDTILIFTTNAGRSLYDNQNKTGISTANSSYHKRTILSALENEKHPVTGQHTFPQAICSRLGQGYPLMFNRLGAYELKKICDAEMRRTEGLLGRRFFKTIGHDDMLPVALLYREGAGADARQIRSEAEKFIKTEIFKYSSLFEQNKLSEVFEEFDSIRFEVETDPKFLNSEVRAVFQSQRMPKILLVVNPDFARNCKKNLTEIDWVQAESTTDCLSILSTEEIDLVLLDIWIDQNSDVDISVYQKGMRSRTLEQGFDFIPLSARSLDKGREILRKIHERSPQTPVYLISFMNKGLNLTSHRKSEHTDTVYFDATKDNRPEQQMGNQDRRPIDEELFFACLRSGGARGMLSTAFYSDTQPDWKALKQQFLENLIDIYQRLYREKQAHLLSKERKVLTFDTASNLDRQKRQLTIRLRNFSSIRAIDANDVGEIISDIERPDTKLQDVFGAKAAKESLHFIVDWLKNPKKFSTMGIRPPKGVLLTGSPGTGKTMLARALAGESSCAFLERSASSFVTIWQGSGPQNVRDLFDRARRYAPTLVFIDEIDAIGIKRGGMMSGMKAQQEALNALLTEMDGFRSMKHQPVIVIAATNLADQLDDTLKRRFDSVIEVDKPDLASRLAYLEKTLYQNRARSVNADVINRIAGQSTGMTIADLERVIHQASVIAAQKSTLLTGEILEEAFETFRIGQARVTFHKPTLLRIARHEAGHALVAWFQNYPPVQVTIVGRGFTGGFMEQKSDEQRMLYTKSEIEDRICIYMGGRSAEILYYGDERGLSTGVSGDLQQATSWAGRMVCEFGMTEEFGIISLRDYYGHGGTPDGPLALKVTEAAERIVRQQLERAIRILNDNRPHLDRLVDALVEKNRLTLEELVKILPKIPNEDSTLCD